MSAGQTTITYGDTTIYNVHTKRFHQEAVFDDSQHHSPYQKTTIEVDGLLHGSSASVLHDHAFGRGAGSPAESHKRLRSTLFHPRRRFEMRVGCAADGSGGEIVFECDPSLSMESGGSQAALRSPDGIDLNGGPKCTSIDVRHISGNAVFRVAATFEICKRECTEAGDAGVSPNPIRSLTWSVSDEIDQNFTTTRMYVGRLTANSSNLDLNSFRGWIVPPVLPGMMRRQMRFDVDKDRMSMDFSILDREVHYSPPAPATSWHYDHNVESGLEQLTYLSTVNCTVKGDRYTTKKSLINLAAQILNAKLYPQAVDGDDEKGAVVLEYLSFTDVVGDDENAVHAQARARYTGSLDFQRAMTLHTLGRPLDDPISNPIPGYDSNYSRGASQRGDELEVEGPVTWRGAITAAFGDACGRFRSLGELARTPESRPIRGDDGDESSEGDPETEVAFRWVDWLPEAIPSFISLGHQFAMFLSWKMETLYDADEGVVGLPVAGRSGGGSGGDSQQPTARFVRLHPAVATRTVRVTGERVGAWPDMPTQDQHTDANGIVVTPLETKVLAPTVGWTIDGQRLYRASVEYKQGLSRPPTANETLVSGYNPWDAFGLYGVPGEAFNVSMSGLAEN